MRHLLNFFADIRLTVVLLGMSILLIFFGTLDQTNIGIKGALRKYFEENPTWRNDSTDQLEKRFHIAFWQYPEEWPYGTNMVLALKKDDPNAGKRDLDLKELKKSNYSFVGYNDNTFYDQARKVYSDAELGGPDLKFGSLTAIKNSILSGGEGNYRVAVLPSSTVEKEPDLATSSIRRVSSLNLHFIKVPLLGGYILGPLLFINLLAAHFVRFKLSWKKAGVFIIHIGLLLMLLSELVTDLTDRESLMVIEEGESATYSTDFDKNELVILDRSNPKVDTLLSIPTEWIENEGSIDVSTISGDFPFTVETEIYYPNTKFEIKEPDGDLTGYPINIAGRTMEVLAEETGKTADPQQINFVSAKVTLRSGDKSYGPFFVSNRFEFFEDFNKHTFMHGERDFAITLQRTRYNYDFKVRLDDFRFLRYPGTEKAKDFTSDVTLIKADGNEEEKRVYMNHPLIFEGSTFFQSGWNEETEKGTRMQVVQNPGKLLPYWGVAIVGVGLMVQFGMHLGRFTKRRGRDSRKEHQI